MAAIHGYDYDSGIGRKAFREAIPCEVEPGRFYAIVDSDDLLHNLRSVHIEIPPFKTNTYDLGQEGWKCRIAHSTPNRGQTRAKIRFYKDDFKKGISLKLPASHLHKTVEEYWEDFAEVSEFMGLAPKKTKSLRWAFSHKEYITEVIDYIKSLGPYKRTRLLNACGFREFLVYTEEAKTIEDQLGHVCKQLREELGEDWEPTKADVIEFPQLVEIEELVRELEETG